MIKGDFINNVFLKTPLQLYLYNIISSKYNARDNSLIVAGPDIIRHLYDARITFGKNSENYINIIELDKDVFKIQEKKLNEIKIESGPVPLWISVNENFIPSEILPIDFKVNLLNIDINNAEVERIIDADLMGTIRKIGPTFINVFNKQCIKFNNDDKIKSFIFTASLRGCSEIDTVSWIRNELLIRIGSEIDFKINNDGSYKKTILTKDIRTRKSTNSNIKCNNIRLYEGYEVIRKGKLEELILFTYSDSKGPMITGLIVYK